jgi:hypothetical protein
MFKKIFLSTAVMVISQMGTIHHVSAMEKIPVIKDDKSKIKSRLSESQERQLIQNRMAIHQGMKHHFGENVQKDVRDVISDKKYALALKEVIHIKCPTLNQLREELEKTGNTKDQNLVFPIMAADHNTILGTKLPKILIPTSMYFFLPDVEFALTLKDTSEKDTSK